MSEMAQVHANHEEKYDFCNLGIVPNKTIVFVFCFFFFASVEP